jgi:hypothetical protein
MTDLGERYTSTCFIDRQRVALNDISLLYGKLYGNAYGRNVSTRLIVYEYTTDDTGQFTGPHGE